MKKDFLKEYLKKFGLGLKDIIKALVISSFINFFILALGLYILDIKNFILIALGISIIDLLPVLGAGAVLIPWAVLVLIMGNGGLALGLGILFVITFLSNQIIEPIVIGKSIGLNPIFTIFITIACILIFSPAIGAILGPLISMAIGVFIELRGSFKEKSEKNEKFSDKNLES